MNDAGDNAASGTSHRISKDSRTATGEEVRHHTRKNHWQAKHREEEHSDNRTDGRTDKADNNCVWCIRKQYRTIQCRLRIRYQLHSNTTERRHDFCQQQTNTSKQYIDTYDKLNCLQEGMYQIICCPCIFCTERRSCEEGRYQEQRNHDNTDRQIGIL